MHVAPSAHAPPAAAHAEARAPGVRGGHLHLGEHSLVIQGEAGGSAASRHRSQAELQALAGKVVVERHVARVLLRRRSHVHGARDAGGAGAAVAGRGAGRVLGPTEPVDQLALCDGALDRRRSSAEPAGAVLIARARFAIQPGQYAIEEILRRLEGLVACRSCRANAAVVLLARLLNVAGAALVVLAQALARLPPHALEQLETDVVALFCPKRLSVPAGRAEEGTEFLGLAAAHGSSPRVPTYRQH
eukprot:scaffold10789_cov141-Isochrysis_galbana.AAC.12